METARRYSAHIKARYLLGFAICFPLATALLIFVLIPHVYHLAQSGSLLLASLRLALGVGLWVYFGFGLLQSLVYYEWDDLLIARRTPLGSSWLNWRDVRWFRDNGESKGRRVTLEGTQGRRLKVDLSMLDQADALHEAIQARLSALLEQATDELEAKPGRVFRKKLLGREPLTIRAEREGLIFNQGPNGRMIRYEDVRVVFYHQDAERYWLSDGQRDLLAIDSAVENHRLLIHYLRRRLAGAPWIETGRRIEPDDPVAAALYQQRRAEERKQPHYGELFYKLLLGVCGGLLAPLFGDYLFDGQVKPLAHYGVLAVLCVFFTAVLSMGSGIEWRPPKIAREDLNQAMAERRSEN